MAEAATGTQTAYFNSTAIQKAEWSEDGMLVVYFVKGGVTTISGVPLSEFRDFAAANSAGLFFNQVFKNRS